MESTSHPLDHIINVDKFQKIQDDIAKATGMAVIAIDLVGSPITHHSQCSSFCNTVRQQEPLNSACEKCDSHGGLEAARNHKPYLYRCHFGIVDFAIPIIANGQYLGAIMAGQVRLAEAEHQHLDLIVGDPNHAKIDDYPKLKPLYDQLAVMSLERIESVAQMISHLVNYIVEEAVLKTSLYEANQQLTEFSKESLKQSESLQAKTHLYYTPSEENSKHTSANIAALEKAQQQSLLTPALKFIPENLNKKLYIEEMAYLCNISPSYFSKIFKREVGLSFPNYINQLKLEQAKKMLQETDQPIVNISLDLGFDDCGYFIKVFKKQEGLTPAAYRKSCREW